MAEWIENFEHASVTDDNRESFSKAMGKYETAEDAIVGGYNAQKTLGSSYRVPESLDSLDDNSKAEFTTKASKLLGIEHAADVAALADINLKKGLPEGSQYDEDFANSFKQFAVDNKIPKSSIEPLAEFFNNASMKAMEAQQAKFEADKQATIDALIAHSDFGSKEKLDEQTVLLHRALTNHLGLNTEEANNIAEFLSNREGATNPVLRRAMLKAMAPLAQEGGTLTGDGTGGSGEPKQPTPYEAKKSRWPKSPESEWGSPTDTWGDMDVHTKKALGYKESA